MHARRVGAARKKTDLLLALAARARGFGLFDLLLALGRPVDRRLGVSRVQRAGHSRQKTGRSSVPHEQRECPLPNGRDFGEDGLIASLRASARLSGSDLLEAMVWDLANAAETDSFPDDVSGIVLDLLPQEAGQHRPVAGIPQSGQGLVDG